MKNCTVTLLTESWLSVEKDKAFEIAGYNSTYLFRSQKDCGIKVYYLELQIFTVEIYCTMARELKPSLYIYAAHRQETSPCLTSTSKTDLLVLVISRIL